MRFKLLDSILFSGLLLLTFSCFAQTPSILKKRIGVHYSLLGANHIFTFQSLEGSAGYTNNGTFSIGLNYERPINDKLLFESGIDYAKHDFIVKPAYMGEGTPASHNESVNMLSFPFLLKVTLGRYLYISGGALLDLDISKAKMVNNQSGLGVSGGLGGQYIFKSGLSLFVQPNLKLHSLVPFNLAKYHSRVLESGVKIGLSYGVK
jgi:hypothetical protein